MKIQHFVSAMLTIIGIFFGTRAYAQPMIFLPFTEGTPVYCSQGNSGDFSHTGDMAYAYDFTGGDEYSINGTSVYAPFTGTVHSVVRNTSASTGWGNTIVLQSGSYLVRMAHLQINSIPSSLTVGTSVQQGQLIGRVGNTGNSTGAHLHIQMMSSSNVNRSIPFEFVEGPVDTDEWLMSDLRENRYVVDNNGRASLGAPFSSLSTSSSGSFSTYGWTDGTHGTNYRGSSSSGARFNWVFRLSLPSAVRSPRMTFWAHCPYSSTRDTATAYTVTPSSGTTIRRTLNQRDFRASSNYQTSIGSQTYSTGTSFTVSAVRGNNRMCADSIVVDLAW